MEDKYNNKDMRKKKVLPDEWVHKQMKNKKESNTAKETKWQKLQHTFQY
jgi:hypothetical protein